MKLTSDSSSMDFNTRESAIKPFPLMEETTAGRRLIARDIARYRKAGLCRDV